MPGAEAHLVKPSPSYLAGATSIGVAAPADGTINVVAASLIRAGGLDEFDVGDGVHPLLTAFYDKDDSREAGANEVEIVIGLTDTADQVRDATIAALNALGDDVFQVTSASGGAGQVALTNKQDGAHGNVAIAERVDNAGFTVVGMANGVNPVHLDVSDNGTPASLVELRNIGADGLLVSIDKGFTYPLTLNPVAATGKADEVVLKGPRRTVTVKAAATTTDAAASCDSGWYR